MAGADGTSGSHSFRGWMVSALLLVVGVAYLCALWGKAATYFPSPLDEWWHSVRSTLLSWCRGNPVLWLAAQIVWGVVIPTVPLVLCGRGLGDMGIGWPNVLGRRLIAISAILSIPFGLWLLSSLPDGPSQRIIDLRYICSLLAIIPEHWLICGIYVALMLPGRRLPNPVPVAPVAGSPPVRVLRWLGLAQPPASPNDNGILAWFGLTGTSLLAILVSGVLFWMVHIGKGGLEVILSLPGGMAVAYVTLRSRSIWPAIFAHWTMNLIPLGLLAVFR